MIKRGWLFEMNQDIITALKNGIENGESLQFTKQILINSGYNSRDVEEASKYVGAGVMPSLQARPGEQLVMPEKKSLIRGGNPALQQNKKVQREFQKIKQEIVQKTPPNYQQLSPKQIPYQQSPVQQEYIQEIVHKKSWAREIILFVILLFLIGLLTVTMIFKDKILSFLA